MGLKPEAIIRYGDPKSESYTKVNDDLMVAERLRFNSNLGIVTIQTAWGQVGIDRDTLKRVGVKKLREIRTVEELKLLIEPTLESLDPRENQEKTIFLASQTLHETLESAVVVKNTSLSGDGMTPEAQFEAGKILQKAIVQAGLETFVEVNKAYGYIQGGDAGSYLFLERVDGFSFQQMQRGEAAEMPEEAKAKLIIQIKDKLEKFKAQLRSLPDFSLAEKVGKENKLSEFARKLSFLNQRTNIRQQKRDEINSQYPLGFDDTSFNYRYFYRTIENKIKAVDKLISRFDEVYDKNDTYTFYNLVSSSLEYILNEETEINPDWIVDIAKKGSYGQDNLMYDVIKDKIIIVDPGPPIGNRRG
jgi:hypothetical protein